MHYNCKNFKYNLLFNEASEDVVLSADKCTMFSRFVGACGGPLLKLVFKSGCNWKLTFSLKFNNLVFNFIWKGNAKVH